MERESTEKEQEALEEFFGYFREQWGPDSKVNNWFEQAFPYQVGNNQGLEGKNEDIKQNRTLKKELRLELFSTSWIECCENSLKKMMCS